MERISKKAVATSKPFKFLIGTDKTEYTIHSALVAQLSPVLSALVNGSFRESSESSVTWDDIDEITFNSFWQFVYTGIYDTPEPLPPTEEAPSNEVLKADIPEDPEPEISESQDPATEPRTEPEAEPEAEPAEQGPETYLCFVPVDATPSSAMKKEKRGGARRTSLWLDFLYSWDDPPEPFDVDVTLKDHANALVHHAKVYTLADRYAITRLTDLSRLNLYQELKDLARNGHGYNNVVELVRYTFEELVPDELRNMVVHFSACVVEHLWKINEFQELVGKYGILSKALVGTMLLRLDENEACLS
ncbi:btb poz fold [Fusarium longipes]|uniref:Btb poz fold n=1 Tax=Fusarium longipes TaxID=694270 RepID=A0A395TAH3_9HYPO|nr:btb poz fold [Fusarium longipes]